MKFKEEVHGVQPGVKSPAFPDASVLLAGCGFTLAFGWLWFSSLRNILLSPLFAIPGFSSAAFGTALGAGCLLYGVLAARLGNTAARRKKCRAIPVHALALGLLGLAWAINGTGDGSGNALAEIALSLLFGLAGSLPGVWWTARLLAMGPRKAVTSLAVAALMALAAATPLSRLVLTPGAVLYILAVGMILACATALFLVKRRPQAMAAQLGATPETGPPSFLPKGIGLPSLGCCVLLFFVLGELTVSAYAYGPASDAAHVCGLLLAAALAYWLSGRGDTLPPGRSAGLSAFALAAVVPLALCLPFFPVIVSVPFHIASALPEATGLALCAAVFSGSNERPEFTAAIPMAGLFLTLTLAAGNFGYLSGLYVKSSASAAAPALLALAAMLLLGLAAYGEEKRLRKSRTARTGQTQARNGQPAPGDATLGDALGDTPEAAAQVPAFQAPPLSSSSSRAAPVVMLVLFYLVHNIGTVFFQARGVPAEQGGNAVVAYFTGIFTGALALALLERYHASRFSGSSAPGAPIISITWVALLFMLVLPAVFCQISFRFTGWEGTPFNNFFQPMLWSMSLPVALRLFFLRVRFESQALFFGIAVGAGHICWALLIPLAMHAGQIFSAGPEVLANGLENRFLSFLNITRNLMQLAFAGLCVHLARMHAAAEPAHIAGEAGETACPYGAASPEGPKYSRRFLLLLLPFLACFFFNGFTGYLFFPRLVGRGLYPEYMHLAQALFFPLLGLWITRQNDTSLPRVFRLLGGAVLSFAIFPLLLFLPLADHAGPSVSHQVGQLVYLVCAITQQILLYCGALAFSRFVPYSRFPALMICAVWLAAAVSIPGRFLAAWLLPALGLSPFLIACVLAVLCLVSLFALYRAFPLPQVPFASLFTGDIPALAAQVAGNLPERRKLDNFAIVFNLSNRETQVLSGYLQNLSLEDICVKLGIRESTLRYHQTGLFKKIGQKSRDRLVRFYETWKPE